MKTTKRTNSLGRAASDCHSCEARSRECDRRRPRCDQCTRDGIVCPGFALKLDWQHGIASRGKLTRKTFPVPDTDTGQRMGQKGFPGQQAPPTSFTFVQQGGSVSGVVRLDGRRLLRGKKKKRPCVADEDIDMGKVPIAPVDQSMNEDMMMQVRERATEPEETMSTLERPSRDTSDRNSQNDREDGASIISANVSAIPEAGVPIVHSEVSRSEMERLLTSTLTPTKWRSLPSFFHLTTGASEAISFFHWRFSFVTLAYDVWTNPWHVCLPIIYDAPCLMDAIIALSKIGRSRLLEEPEDPSVLVLKNRALSSFGSILQTGNVAVIIATILVLIGIDYAESAYSCWSTHLMGAYRVLESGSGIRVAQFSSSLRSQIAMLIWYDLTGALLSRRRPVFPRNYIEDLFAWQSSTEWTFLALNGYPDELIMVLHDLATAAEALTTPTDEAGARQAEVARELERRLWVAELRSVDADVTILFECWRMGLLLYCARALKTAAANPFTQQQQQRSQSASMSPRMRLLDRSLSSSPAFTTASDNTLMVESNNATSNRCKCYAEDIFYLTMRLSPTSALQKQCLIPMLLAGCEMTSSPDDLQHRKTVETYCDRWNSLSQLAVFSSAKHVLRIVWALKDGGFDFEKVWWVDVLNKTWAMQDSQGSLTKEWLFG